MKVGVVCEACNSINYYDWRKGLFDEILFDEPRFPGYTVYECGKCGRVSRVGSGIRVQVLNEGKSFSIRVKADEYVMSFRVRDVTGVQKEFDISRFEEVVGRFLKNGSLPD